MFIIMGKFLFFSFFSGGGEIMGSMALRLEAWALEFIHLPGTTPNLV